MPPWRRTHVCPTAPWPAMSTSDRLPPEVSGRHRSSADPSHPFRWPRIACLLPRQLLGGAARRDPGAVPRRDRIHPPSRPDVGAQRISMLRQRAATTGTPTTTHADPDNATSPAGISVTPAAPNGTLEAPRRNPPRNRDREPVDTARNATQGRGPAPPVQPATLGAPPCWALGTPVREARHRGISRSAERRAG
jgi:hypothetical protein